MTDPFPAPASFADDFLTTVADPANIQWSSDEESNDESSKINGVMRFTFPARPRRRVEAVLAEIEDPQEKLKAAQRPVLLSAIDEAFFRGINIREAKHAAQLLLPGATEWLSSGHAIEHTMSTLAAAGKEVPRSTAHVIASSLVFYTACKDGGKHRWMAAGILGQLSRSYMVEDRHGILGNWQWITLPKREATPDGSWRISGGVSTTPIISSLVRDRLWEPVDLGSVVEGVAMLPDEVRRFFSFGDL
jgi:hypothetical protein